MKLNIRPLLRLIFTRFFGAFSGFVDMCVDHIPAPEANARTKIETCFKGPIETPLAQAMLECNCSSDQPLVVHVTKQYPIQDASVFHVFGVVLSGTLRAHQTVKVLGESYSSIDVEDSRILPIGRLWIYQSRYRIEVESVPAGNCVLIEGIDQSVVKTATIVDANIEDDETIYISPTSIQYTISNENCSWTRKSIWTYRKCWKDSESVTNSYPLLTTKVEESGEHVILGTGELYLDCVMHDLRRMYSEIDIKVADPCCIVLWNSRRNFFIEGVSQKLPTNGKQS